MANFFPKPEFINYATEVLNWTYPNNTQMMMLGEDGKHYSTWHTTQGGAGRYYVINIEDGILTQYSQAQFKTDVEATFPPELGSLWTFPDMMIPAPGTPYYYLIRDFDSNPTLEVLGLRYKINSSGVSIVDGGVFNASSRPAIGVVPDYVLGFNLISCSQVIDNTLYFVYQLNDDRPFLMNLPLTGTVNEPTVGTWENRSRLLGFGSEFYTLGEWKGNNYNPGGIIKTNGSVGVLAYVGRSQIDGTTPANTNVAAIGLGNPPQIWYSEDDTGYTDMSEAFGFPWDDVDKLYTGAASDTNYDDYSGPSSFLANDGEWYVAFTRSYSDNGEMARLKLFSWNDGSPSLVADKQVKWVDHVTNLGVIESERYLIYPYAIHVGYDSGSNRLMANGHYVDSAYQSDDYQVYSWLGGFDNPNESVKYLYFSDFTEDTDYLDWNEDSGTVVDALGATVVDQNGVAVTHGGLGANYTAFLETAWTIPEADFTTFFGSPFIYSFMNNKDNIQVTDALGADVVTITDQLVTAGVNYGLTLKGKWDWVEKG